MAVSSRVAYSLGLRRLQGVGPIVSVPKFRVSGFGFRISGSGIHVSALCQRLIVPVYAVSTSDCTCLCCVNVGLTTGSSRVAVSYKVAVSCKVSHSLSSHTSILGDI